MAQALSTLNVETPLGNVEWGKGPVAPLVVTRLERPMGQGHGQVSLRLGVCRERSGFLGTGGGKLIPHA